MELPEGAENTREKGSKGEALAADYLVGKNFEIIKTNFHFGRYGEIDIIAKDKETLVFVEVKSRISSNFPDPLFAINHAKIQKLRRVAEGFIHVNQSYIGMECRFDVISIDFTHNPPLVNHIENAIY